MRIPLSSAGLLRNSILAVLLMTVPLDAQVFSIAGREIGSTGPAIADTIPGNIEDLSFRRMRGNLFPEEPARFTIWKPFDMPTVGVQLASGTILSYGFAYVLVGSYQSPRRGLEGLGDNIAFAVLTVLLSNVVISPATVFASGSLMGGNGGFLWTALGGLSGTIAGIITGSAFQVDFPAVFLFSTCGSIAGFHLSSEKHLVLKAGTAPRPDAGWTFSLAPKDAVTMNVLSIPLGEP